MRTSKMNIYFNVLATAGIVGLLNASVYSSTSLDEANGGLEATKHRFVEATSSFLTDVHIKGSLETAQEAAEEVLYTFARHFRADMKHDQQAFSLMEAAAKLGCIPAQHDLAVMIEHGLGCEKDLKQAIEWYKRSADSGYALAENNLGAIYELGHEGVERDELKALELYERAANHGLALGLTNLERLLKELDEEDESKES